MDERHFITPLKHGANGMGRLKPRFLRGGARTDTWLKPSANSMGRLKQGADEKETH